MINDTAIATRRSEISVPETVFPSSANLAIFKSDAPIITGIAMKKENSALAVRETPLNIPPRMVEPDLDVPGMSDKTWNEPIISASL